MTGVIMLVVFVSKYVFHTSAMKTLGTFYC